MSEVSIDVGQNKLGRIVLCLTFFKFRDCVRPLYGKGLDCYNLKHNFELCCAEAENLKFLSTEKMIFRNETYLIQLIMKVL